MLCFATFSRSGSFISVLQYSVFYNLSYTFELPQMNKKQLKGYL